MKKFLKKRTKGLLILCVLIAIVLLAFDTRLKIVEYTVETDKITSPLCISLVTDLHSCKYGSGQKNLIDAINAQKPDIVLFGGDICDDVIPHNNTELVLKEIANKYPCFYVSGNHEYWSKEIDKIKEMFRAYGVKVLEGSCEVISINGNKINICGIDDPDAEKYTDNKETLYQQLEACKKAYDNKYYTILLAHRPCYIKTYFEHDFDLVLSGHAHGGQWRIPGILNGLYAPDEGWFPKYAGGRYEVNGSTMIVSRGLARESTRVPRIFNHPELVTVILKPKK